MFTVSHRAHPDAEDWAIDLLFAESQDLAGPVAKKLDRRHVIERELRGESSQPTQARESLECVAVIIRSVPLKVALALNADPRTIATDPLAGRQLPPQPLTTGLMRGPKWASLILEEKGKRVEELRRAEAMVPGMAHDLKEAAEALRTLRRLQGRFKTKTGHRRFDAPRPTDQEVADVYNANQRLYGENGAPTRAIAEAFGVPRSTANKWKARAQTLGLTDLPIRKGRPRKPTTRRTR